MRNIILLLILILSIMIEAEPVTIMAPDNPGSLPLIIAVDNIPELEIKLFSNHAQAHSLFLAGKVPLLMTGYAVGESFSQRGVPVKMIASWVSGMDYLVTADTVYSSFLELKGQKLYFPFEGSPIEKLSLWLAGKEGIDTDKDLEIGYLPFESMLQLMRQGKISNAVMPVSSALQIVDDKHFFLSFDLNDKWYELTGSEFYPQVCLFVNPKAELDYLIPELITELQKACEMIELEPDEVIFSAGSRLSYSSDIIRKSLKLQKFELIYGTELETAMEQYFEKSGITKPPSAFYQADQ